MTVALLSCASVLHVPVALLQAPPAAKLPALFLLDSISKNAKEPFIQIFSRNLPQALLL